MKIWIRADIYSDDNAHEGQVSFNITGTAEDGRKVCQEFKHSERLSSYKTPYMNGDGVKIALLFNLINALPGMLQHAKYQINKKQLIARTSCIAPTYDTVNIIDWNIE